MNEMSYKKVMQWAEAVPVRKKLLCLLNTLLPVIIGGMYAFCMVVCFFFISGITGFAGFKTAPLFLYSDSAAVSAEISETL